MESSIDTSEKDVEEIGLQNDAVCESHKMSLDRYARRKPEATTGYNRHIKLDLYDIFLDRWIRGRKHNGDTWNRHEVRYDETLHRWYLYKTKPT